MIEYVLIAAFLVTAWLLFKCRFLNSKRWFVLLSVVLTLGILAYLVIDSSQQWNLKKTILLILVVGSVTATLLKRASAQNQNK